MIYPDDVVIVDSDHGEAHISDFNNQNNQSNDHNNHNHNRHQRSDARGIEDESGNMIIRHRVPYTATNQDSISIAPHGNHIING